MPSEETPLLSSIDGGEAGINSNATDAGLEMKHLEVYERFTSRKKMMIIALVAWGGLMPLFASGSFFPSVPQIARDLDSTSSTVSLAISLSVFASSIGSLTGATYSTFYGRKPVYLYAMSLLCVCSLGVGLSRSIPELMIWRFLQAAGSGPGLSVGAGVIGDIYRLEQRGAATGVFLSACLLGPTLAPVAGGLAAYYASWRFMQAILSVCGLLGFLMIWQLFPETSHPGSTGIEKRPLNADGTKNLGFVFVNPLTSIELLRSPNLLTMSVATFLVLMTDFVLLVPMAYTIGQRYNISNEALIGALYLPIGLGETVGAPIVGRLTDIDIVRRRKQRNGVWYPEDRLRVALVGAAIFAPLSVLFSGIITRFVPGTLGLVLNLMCFFMNGIGIQSVLGPVSAYLVDILRHRSAESIAACSGLRGVLVAMSIAAIFPLIDTIGAMETNMLAASMAWMGFGMLYCVVRYGERMRNWVDMGYTTSANN